MITLDQIRPLRGNQFDIDETEALKKKMAGIRAQRQPLFLTKDEFEVILDWKLGRQRNRGEYLRVGNTEELIRAVTQGALSFTHADKDYELELRLNILCSLRGVGVPVASAVLALIFPEDYGVIDFRAWRQLFDSDKRVFWLREYKQYMAEIRRLSRELGWPPQEVDHAIWEYDRIHGWTAP